MPAFEHFFSSTFSSLSQSTLPDSLPILLKDPLLRLSSSLHRLLAPIHATGAFTNHHHGTSTTAPPPPHFHQRYYLKLDLDCVLRPPRLLAFLDFLHRRVAPDSPLHFGTTTLGAGGGKKTTTWGFDVDRPRFELLRSLASERKSAGTGKRSVELEFTRRSTALGMTQFVKNGLTPKQKGT